MKIHIVFLCIVGFASSNPQRRRPKNPKDVVISQPAHPETSNQPSYKPDSNRGFRDAVISKNAAQVQNKEPTYEPGTPEAHSGPGSFSAGAPSGVNPPAFIPNVASPYYPNSASPISFSAAYDPSNPSSVLYNPNSASPISFSPSFIPGSIKGSFSSGSSKSSQGFSAPRDPHSFHQSLDSTDIAPTFAAPGFHGGASSAQTAASFQGFNPPKETSGFQGFTAFQSSGSRQGVASPGYTVGGGIQYSGLDEHKTPEFDGSTYYGTSQPHTFGYSVSDAHYGNTHAHNEYSDGQTTQGEYRVLLPDGRTQVVKYSADAETGFQAKVTYEGEAKPYVPPKQKSGGGGGHGGQFKPRPQTPTFSAPGGSVGFQGHSSGSGGFGIGVLGGGGGGGGGAFRKDKAPIYTPSGGAFKQ